MCQPKLRTMQSNESGFSGGMAGAQARGEDAKREWISTGEVVAGESLANVWGITPQALGRVVRLGELFAVVVDNERYYPSEFLQLRMSDVSAICKELAGLDFSELFIFFKQKHGALGGKTVVQALTVKSSGGAALARVIALAQAKTAQMGAEAARNL